MRWVTVGAAALRKLDPPAAIAARIEADMRLVARMAAEYRQVVRDWRARPKGEITSADVDRLEGIGPGRRLRTTRWVTDFDLSTTCRGEL